MEKETARHQDEKAKSDAVIKSLTEITTEYKAHAEQNKALAAQIGDLKNQLAELARSNESLTTANDRQAQENAALKISFEEERQRVDNEQQRSIEFIQSSLSLEKNQAVLAIREELNEKINGLHDHYQTKISGLLQQIEQSMAALPQDESEDQTTASKAPAANRKKANDAQSSEPK